MRRSVRTTIGVFAVFTFLRPMLVNAQTQSVSGRDENARQTWVGVPLDQAGFRIQHAPVGTGDDLPDLIVGAPGIFSNAPGSVRIIFSGVPRAASQPLSAADVVITGTDPNDWFGYALATGHFFNTPGSGPPALLVSAPHAPIGGKVFLFRGGFTSGSSLNVGDALVEIRAPNQEFRDNLGLTLAAGDLNGDGLEDIIIGSTEGSSHFNKPIYIIWGRASFDHTGPPIIWDLATQPPDIELGRFSRFAPVLKAGHLTHSNPAIADLLIGIPRANGVCLIKGRDSTAPPFPSVIRDLPCDAVFSGADADIPPWDTASEAGSAVEIGDLDGDGHPDLIIAAPNGDASSTGTSDRFADYGEVFVIWGDGSPGAFTSRSLATADLRISGPGREARLGQTWEENHFDGLATGDMNGDGIADLLATAWRGGEVLVFHGRPRALFGTPDADGVVKLDSAMPNVVDVRIFDIDQPVHGLDVVDTDNNGIGEIVLGSMRIFDPNSQVPGQVFVMKPPTLGVSQATVSWSRVVATPGTSVRRIRVRDSGTSGISWTANTDQTWITVSPTSGFVAAGQHGLVDILMSAEGLPPGTHIGAVTITSTDGLKSVSFAVMLTVLPRPPTLELFWQHQTSGNLAMWKMLDLALGDGAPLEPNRVADLDWRIEATGDFDGDGQADLLWRNRTSGAIAAWFMNDGVQTAGVPLGPGLVADTSWRIAATGDFNADGQRDIVWQHDGTGQISAWLMNGTSVIDGLLFTPGQVPDTNWKIVGSGDFNGDGRADLVWRHNTEGLVAIWLMSGTTLIDGVLTTPSRVADTAWEIRAIGDINADGHSDLIWQHRTTGHLAAWLMNGTTLVDGSLLSPPSVPDLNWKIVGPR